MHLNALHAVETTAKQSHQQNQFQMRMLQSSSTVVTLVHLQILLFAPISVCVDLTTPGWQLMRPETD